MNKETMQNKVMDFDAGNNSYTDFNSALSSDFNFENVQQSPSFGIRSNGEKLNFRG